MIYHSFVLGLLGPSYYISCVLLDMDVQFFKLYLFAGLLTASVDIQLLFPSSLPVWTIMLASPQISRFTTATFHSNFSNYVYVFSHFTENTN